MEYGRPGAGGNAAGCRGSGSTRTLIALKASNVARAALHSCGSYADSLAGVMGNEVAAHRKLLSQRMLASVDRDEVNRFWPASWSLPSR